MGDLVIFGFAEQVYNIFIKRMATHGLSALNDLAAFAVVAEEESFTRAASRLGMSQPALSHAMRGLEERLKVRLLARTTRSVSTTEAGDTLLRPLRPALEDLRPVWGRSAPWAAARRAGSPDGHQEWGHRCRHAGIASVSGLASGCAGGVDCRRQSDRHRGEPLRRGHSLWPYCREEHVGE